MLLDATDRGRLWEAIGAKFPSYQILPDTNHVSYIKNNLLASLYTIGKSANIYPTSSEDSQIIGNLNILMDHIWGISNVAKYQMAAGERAALTNLGITQVGWNTELPGGNGNYFYKGGPVLKNIDPTKFMRDPYSESLETAGYCMTWDDLHVNVLKSNPKYKDTLDAALKSDSGITDSKPTELYKDNYGARPQKDYVRLITHWVRIGDIYHEIHTLNNVGLLDVIEAIDPACFPFSTLYCNLPSGDLVGTSECSKVFANSVAYNLLNSIMLTSEYKNQNPPKFVSSDSGLNVATFMKHGNDAGYAFMVNGDATKAVHYHEFPQPSNTAPQTMSRLTTDVQSITGVDGKYTGSDSGSVITTGGVEALLDQATMIDGPKIANYEDYTKRLCQLLLANFIAHGGTRKYFIQSPSTLEVKDIEVAFDKLNKETLYRYELNISSELPKSKARVAQWATSIMTAQMQYGQQGQSVPMMTQEEWLMLQDTPVKEFMQKRMGIQRSKDYTEQVAKTLFTFASFAKAGVPPEEAIAMTAEQMQAGATPGMEQQTEFPAPEPELPPAVDYSEQEDENFM
jgi:hypothetical protein